jgi:hypothetical protein
MDHLLINTQSDFEKKLTEWVTELKTVDAKAETAHQEAKAKNDMFNEWISKELNLPSGPVFMADILLRVKTKK